MFYAWFLFNSHVSSVSTSVERDTYIIHMDKSLMPKAFTNHHHWYSSTLDSLSSGRHTPSDDPDSIPTLLYSYDHVAHGFSAFLSLEELEALQKSPAFVSAYSDRAITPDTTHTPEFLSLNPSSGLWPASDYGKDVIIGVIDSGVWPESKSFKDDGMTQVPARWKGTCQEGTEFNSSMCNLKLIGARHFNKGLIAKNPGINITMNSARDTRGHGTHTASTAAGNYVEDVSFFGYAKGTARGIAPRARVAVYKVLWPDGCYTSDFLAAMDQAVADGVDVMSISLGFEDAPFYMSPIAIGAFGATEKGVFISFSAGNDGPSLGRLHNGFPWTLNVAAGSVDRTFAGTVTLGNGLTIVGWTMFPASALLEHFPLYYNKNLSGCEDTKLLSQSPYAIIICENTKRIFYQLDQVARSNAAGAIFISDDQDLLQAGGIPWPGVVISPKEGPAVIQYAKTEKDPWATIKFQQTILGIKPSPAVASYSSRGPSLAYPGILKPDLMAPGTLILAAYVPDATTAMIGGGIALSSEYNMITGTSMACPHAAGVAALLKEAHPEWSPAAIRSAMMTTANPFDNNNKPIQEIGQNLSYASPLAIGAGQIDPNKALDPGLVYDATTQDYVDLLCSMNYTKKQIQIITRSKRYNCSNPYSDLNYPSFIFFYTNKTTVMTQKFHRTLTNVGNGSTSYVVRVRPPKDSQVTVSPDTLEFEKKYDKQSYTLAITYNNSKNEEVTYGSIVWLEEDGKHLVRSPLVVSPF